MPLLQVDRVVQDPTGNYLVKGTVAYDITTKLFTCSGVLLRSNTSYDVTIYGNAIAYIPCLNNYEGKFKELFPDLHAAQTYHSLCNNEASLDEHLTVCARYASDTDINGRRKGDIKRYNHNVILPDGTPIFAEDRTEDFEAPLTQADAALIAARVKGTVRRYPSRFYLGKTRDLPSARASAFGLKLTDEEWMLPGDELRKLLSERKYEIFREAYKVFEAAGVKVPMENRIYNMEFVG